MSLSNRNLEQNSNQASSFKIAENRLVFQERQVPPVNPALAPKRAAAPKESKDKQAKPQGLIDFSRQLYEDLINTYDDYEDKIKKGMKNGEHPDERDIKFLFSVELDAEKILQVRNLIQDKNVLRQPFRGIGLTKQAYENLKTTKNVLDRLNLLKTLNVDSYQEKWALLMDEKEIDNEKFAKLVKGLRKIGYKGQIMELYRVTENGEEEKTVKEVSDAKALTGDDDKALQIVLALKGDVDGFVADVEEALALFPKNIDSEAVKKIFLENKEDTTWLKNFILSIAEEFDISNTALVTGAYRLSKGDVENGKRIMRLFKYGMRYDEVETMLHAKDLKSAENAIAFMEEIKDLGFSISPYDFYEIENDAEVVKKQKGMIKKMYGLGFNQLVAFRMGIAHGGSSENDRINSLNVIIELQKKYPKVKSSILFALVRQPYLKPSYEKADPLSEAQKLIDFDKGEGSLLCANELEALKFIDYIQRQLSFEGVSILYLWKLSHDGKTAVDLHHAKCEKSIAGWKEATSYAKEKGLDYYNKLPERHEELVGAILKIKEESKGNENRFELLKFMYQNTNFTTAYNVGVFLKDPAFTYCEKVQGIIHDPGKALKIGRNLFLEKKPLHVITEETINGAERKIEEEKDKYKDVEIFKGRNVILVGNSELWQNRPRDPTIMPDNLLGKPRFLDPETIDAVKKNIGGDNPEEKLQTFKPSSETPSVDELKKMEDAILLSIETTPPPLTFLFDGHGLEDGLFYINGYVSNDIKNSGKGKESMSAEKLAKAIAKRKENFPGREEDLAKDVYIFSSCYSHTYARRVIDINKENGGIQPVFVGVSEYGQYGFSTFEFDKSYNKTFGIGQEDSTLGALFGRAKDSKNSHISIYLPDQNNAPKQVVENETPNKNRAIG